MQAGRGSDVLEGGAGADQFIFGSGHQFNFVRDFQNGVDKIKIKNGAFSFNQLNISEVQGDAVVRFNGTTVRLDRVDSDVLDASDFIFERRRAEKPEEDEPLLSEPLFIDDLF